MQLSSKDQILKVMALTRFHFVAGMPKSGARCLANLLAQNSRFEVVNDSPAEQVFDLLQDETAPSAGRLSELGCDTKTALLRSALDAVHHARPLDATVVDNNPAWLPHIPALAEIMPLSRFVVMVRDPAKIAAEMAGENGDAKAPSSLMAQDGAIGAPLRHIQAALNSPEAERLLLIDYDRLLADPERVLAVMYGFLREAVFTHDLRMLPKIETHPLVASGRFERRVVAFKKSLTRRPAQANLPIWRRSPGTSATMLLSETG